MSEVANDQKGRSVTQKQTGLAVAASPFNGIKLELALILCAAVVLLVVLPRFTHNVWSDMAILAIFGMLGGAWIMFRARRIARRLQGVTTAVDKQV